MGDFYHMFIEETSDLGAFISGGSRVHHVHLASATSASCPARTSGSSSTDSAG